MKAVILAGGLGTRLAEETHLRPKPMVEIGGQPILWHIMKSYAHYGIKDFIICCGYKAETIKEYFANYYLHTSDIRFSLASHEMSILGSRSEDWTVTLIDTGLNTMTGGRLKRVARYLDDDADFCFTYGDGVSDVDIGRLVEFHRSHGGEATVTGALPPARFGAMTIHDTRVTSFQEKPKGEVGYVNAGFFVLNRSVLSRLGGDDCVWEQEPLTGLARDNQLYVYEHDGFWQPMDTLRDKQTLDNLLAKGTAPWKVWT